MCSKANVASNCDFDASIFVSQYLKEENIDELKINEVSKPNDILQNIQHVSIGKPSLLTRTFIKSCNGEQGGPGNVSKPKLSFRVMQWNALAQGLCSGTDNFIRCPEEALSWDFRRLRLLEEILTVDPDILCLQEVDHFGFYLQVLEKIGYRGTFFPKPHSPCLHILGNNGPDGCAIFYKDGIFRSLGKDSIVLLHDQTKEETNQVSVILRFVLKNDPKYELVVATTHLKSKPGWAALRDAQGTYLVKYLKEKFQDKPLIICGDFNAEPTEKIYERFATSELELDSAYKKLDQTSSEAPYTTWKIRGKHDAELEVCHTIDYMWYTRKFIGVEALLSIPTDAEIGPDRLPSFSYPSDHLSLAADFVFIEV